MKFACPAAATIDKLKRRRARSAMPNAHPIASCARDNSGARLSDLAEHADAWNGEVTAQGYLHGLDRPEAKRSVKSLCHNT